MAAERNDVYEQVKELSVYVLGVGRVKARILEKVIRSDDTDDHPDMFICEFSHYCKPFEDAFDTYVPGNTVARDQVRVEYIAKSYLEKFTGDFHVQKNEDW